MRAYVDAEAAGGSQSGDAKVAVPAEKRFWSNRAVVLPGFSLTFKGRAGVGMGLGCREYYRNAWARL